MLLFANYKNPYNPSLSNMATLIIIFAVAALIAWPIWCAHMDYKTHYQQPLWLFAAVFVPVVAIVLIIGVN